MRKIKWGALVLTISMILSLTACSDLDTKEIVETIEESVRKQEKVVEEDQEKASEELISEPAGESVSKEEVQKEKLYTIKRDDVDHLITEFLQFQAESVFKAKNNELNSLSPIDVMDKYAGVLTTDERYKVVADYNSNALSGLKKTQEILLASRRKFYRDYAEHMSMYFQVGISVTESNIDQNGGFRYYGGTDVSIGVKLKYNFFFCPDPFETPFYLGADPTSYADSYVNVYNSESDVMQCPDLYAVLVNCGDDTWGIQFFVADDRNSIPDGEAFTGVLVNEDEKEAVAAINENQKEAGISWKKIYLNEIQAGKMEDADSYCLKDINGDSIPELYTDSSFDYYTGVLGYIKKDGTVGYIGSAYGYTSDKIATDKVHRGVTYNEVYQYDSSTGDYILIFDGYIEESLEQYYVNNQQCSKGEYYDQLNAAWSPSGYSHWENVQPILNDSLINSIAEYDDSTVIYGQFPVPEQTDQTAVQSSGEYLLPDSNSRYLTEAEIRALSKEELRIARNEVYARHGRKFNSEDLQAYFNSKSWYSGTIESDNFNEAVLNGYEKANLDLIRAVEGN